MPESAVVDTGTRAVVFVEQMPGMFDSVEIAVGPRCGDVYPVASGLEPGSRVAIILPNGPELSRWPGVKVGIDWRP